MPREDGYDVVDGIKAMSEEKAKIFIALGGNFLSATTRYDIHRQSLTKAQP